MAGTTLLLLLHASTLATAQVPDTPAKHDLVLQWNDLALQAVRAERTAPPMVARNLAVLHLAIYDAVNAVERTHQPYYVEVTPEDGTSPEAAASAAAYTTLCALFPKQKQTFAAAYAKNLATLPEGEARTNGMLLGQFVAEKMLALRANDGASAKPAYRVRGALGKWSPTLPEYREALYPGWGNVTPFAIRRGSQYRPAEPPPLNSPAYAKAYNEVKELGGKDSKVRTPDQTQIALFWADDAGTSTPPGHWNKIAQTIARERRLSLAESARLFALLNMSLADAAVLCWVHKFTHEVWRPVTAIRLAADDGNPDTEPDPYWAPLVTTPPFPAYTSGHSTFSGAAATLLANYFGNDRLGFATTSEGLPGVTRSFDSVWAAAEEAGMSRIYGGIHWQFDNTEGLATGRHLAGYVFQNYLRPRTQRVLYPPR